MKFIKKHKVALIVTLVIIILLILVFFGIKSAFFANINESKYGNRLDGIENYPIEESTITDIKTTISENDFVNSVNYDLKGRVMYFTIIVKDDVDLTTSRGLADKIAEKFTDEIKSYYDIQVLIDSDAEESENYPTMGAKHKTSVGFKWDVD